MHTGPRAILDGVVDSRRVGHGAWRGPTALVRAGALVLALSLPCGVHAQAPASPDSTRADVPAAPAGAAASPATVGTSRPSSSSLTVFDDPKRKPRTSLPFSGNPAPRTFPEVSFGVGMGGYVSGFRGADRAFRAIEDSIRRAGFDVRASSTDHSLGMYLLTLNANAGPALGASLQMGGTFDANNDVRLAGGIVWGCWSPPDARSLSLGAGLGGGLYRFRFTRKYGIIIATDGAGGYTTLDDLRFEGGGAYVTAAGRATMRSAVGAALEGTVQYVGAGDVTGEIAGAGHPFINVSGFILNLSLAIPLP